jgi:AraC family transcriptional regulator of arabinose operon
MAPEPEPERLSQTYLRVTRGSVTVGDVLYARGGSFGPRIQTDFQLVIVHSGSLSLELDGETLDVPENHGILLGPGHTEHFFFAQDRETHHSWVAIAPDALSQELRNEFSTLRGPIPFLGRMASLMGIAKKDTASISSSEVLQNGLYQGFAISIMCDFASAVRTGHKAATASDTVLSRMECFLNDTYTRQLTLKEIARAAGVSQQHLLKLCRLAGKPTPMKQLSAKRLEMAADLLLHTGFSISEIAEQCGFVNQFHFSRKFKQSAGRSPLAWRSQLWKHGRQG